MQSASTNSNTDVGISSAQKQSTLMHEFGRLDKELGQAILRRRREEGIERHVHHITFKVLTDRSIFRDTNRGQRGIEAFYALLSDDEDVSGLRSQLAGVRKELDAIDEKEQIEFVKVKLAKSAEESVKVPLRVRFIADMARFPLTRHRILTQLLKAAVAVLRRLPSQEDQAVHKSLVLQEMIAQGHSPLECGLTFADIIGIPEKRGLLKVAEGDFDRLHLSW